MFGLPTTATAPFCPTEVRGSVLVPKQAPWWRKLMQYAGPGLLVSVGYMDPGNWATDIEAGSRYGYGLLWLVLGASLVAILLQCLSMRLGLVARRDLAQLCRERYAKPVAMFLWVLAELAIIACDLAEVLGSGLALHLLFNISLLNGIAITALDTLLVLGLKGKGFRQIEAIVLGLILAIGICYAVELLLVQPDWLAVARGFIPDPSRLDSGQALYLSVGILGATVMPHNLYLHSSIVQTRLTGGDASAVREAIRYSTADTVASLSLALIVNSAILILAAAAFNAAGHTEVAELQDAYRLLEPLVGAAAAATLFGVALLASGQSATFTGTIAGQILMEGFLNLSIPCWHRRLITRALALIPAFIGVAWLGDGAVGKLVVASQVVLSFQLPFAIWPLIRFTSDRALMGEFASGVVTRTAAWAIFALIGAANGWLVLRML
ncbi:MAG: divalent metal cation transporter [Betaproteobacteria bacterium]|nr:divalent metal cation transporter [Betaproteobacteria bacterium]